MAKSKGDGSIQELERGVYRVSVSLGKDPVTGKYRRVTKTVRGTKANARKVRDEIRRDHEDGLKVDALNITFSEMVGLWESAKRAKGKASDDTIDGYILTIKRVIDILGGVPVTQIDAQVIDSLFAKLRAETDLSGTTLNMMFKITKSVMCYAVNYDYIRKNPLDICDAPEKSDPNRNYLSADRCKELEDALDKAEVEEYAKRDAVEEYHDKYQSGRKRESLRGVMRISCIMVVRLAFATGMRRSEILALRWNKLDMRNARLEVDSARDKHGKLKGTKSKAGNRVVAIDSKTMKHLVRWKHHQSRYFERIGVDVTEETYICCSNNCGMLEPTRLESWWRKFRKDNGFDGLLLHELRHTQATLLLANGTDVKTVQTRLGHSESSTTLDMYAHAVHEKDDEASDLFRRVVSGDAKPKTRVISLVSA